MKQSSKLGIFVALGVVFLGIVFVFTRRAPLAPSPTISSAATAGGATATKEGRKPGAGAAAPIPTEVGLPSGDVVGQSGSDPRWSVKIAMPYGLVQSLQNTKSYYLSKGFISPSGNSATPNHLESSNFTVDFIGENADHSATRTNVTIIIARR